MPPSDTALFAANPARTPARPDPMGYKVVSVRLREAEYLAFSEQVSQLGISGNLAMRIAARRIGGFLDVDQATREALASITGQIGEISTALNTLISSAAGDPSVDMDKLTELRVGFGTEFARLDAQLQTILNISKRRQDGQQLLVEAAQ